MCQKVFFNEVTGQQPRTLFKKESDAGFFCEFCKIFRVHFLKNTRGGYFHTESKECKLFD